MPKLTIEMISIMRDFFAEFIRNLVIMMKNNNKVPRFHSHVKQFCPLITDKTPHGVVIMHSSIVKKVLISVKR